MSGRSICPGFRAFAGMALLLAALSASAQHQHDAHAAMAGMEMPASAASVAPAAMPMQDMAMPAASASSAPPTAPMTMHAHDGQAMSTATTDDRRGAMPSMQGHAGAAPATTMTMGPMQGGRPPPGARSADYSDGVAPSHLPGMDMAGDGPFALLRLDQLEAFAGRDEHGQRWELQGWYGNDDDKLQLRSEGERSGDRISEGDAEALWSHAVATYWDTTLGVRHDFGEGPRRDWLAFGVQGLAPYWFELEATGYAGPAGRTAARLRVDYELLFTQRLILQPELETNLYGRDDPGRGIGRGLSDLQFGVRLRYEIRRELAPYVGVQFTHRFGRTADFARNAGMPVSDRQVVLGLRLWF